MESNSDKQLRDKLAGTEFPFDPRAWEQMEAMLDKKKKRRGFFWWWTTGGITAALLFGVIGYEVGVSNGRLQVAGNRLNSPAGESVDHSSQSAVNTESKIAQSTSGSQQEQLNNPLRDQKQNESVTNEVNSTPTNPSEKKAQRSGLAKHTNPGFSVGIAGVNAGKGVSYDRKNLRKQGGKKALLAKQGAGMNAGAARFEESPAQSEVSTLASATSSQSLFAQRIEMDRRAGLLDAAEEQYSFDKKSDDALPETKKKIFNYSIGALANVSGTTVGKQSGASTFYSAPSFAAGFTHEFLFLNRIAISNSILYAQTGFKILNPEAPEDSSAIKNYSSSISELQIPLGIKVYPVAKKCFRFSIAGGIINHIKLKEIFTVERESPQVIPNSLTAADNSIVSTANNPFLGGLSKSSNLQDASNASSPSTQGEYFGIGGLKRYYASFYASAGIEFIAKKHFIFFTEPMFYVSLNKIGVQDKRKYNVGANAGFRYQF